MMPMKWILLVLALVPAANAQSLDDDFESPLEKTQELLTKPKLRNEAIKASPQAQAVDKNVNEVTGGGANADQAYRRLL
jgi:hypothetical protein